MLRTKRRGREREGEERLQVRLYEKEQFISHHIAIVLL